MTTSIDHIVIGATDLNTGVKYVEQQLGVTVPAGGEHPAMGTHNHLMQLGNNAFLEVIAINPAAAPPHRPRWYGLDDPAVRKSIETELRLLTWVLNTADINALVNSASIFIGTPTTVSRGNLSWDFGLPDDGRLLAGGIIPYAIEWHTDEHPSKNMADLKCNLKSIDIHHPYIDWLKELLDSLGAVSLANLHKLGKGETPFWSATIETPAGVVCIDSK